MASDDYIDQRIFVKDFPRETTDSELKAFFETYGTVLYANIIADKSHKSGPGKYGFVTFESKEVFNTVVQLKSVKFQDKTLCIAKARRRNDPVRRIVDGAAAHTFNRRHLSSRQSTFEYTPSSAPMGYLSFDPHWLVCNQSPCYFPATVQAPPVAQLPSTSYISGNSQVLTVSGNGASNYVQEQFVRPMARTNFVEGYADYPYISFPLMQNPYITLHPAATEWTSTENGATIFTKEVRTTFCLFIDQSLKLIFIR